MNLSKSTILILYFLFQMVPMLGKAQDSLLVDFLLKRIGDEQVKSDDFFLHGIYPSYITKSEKFNSRKKDNNIFFNGLIAFTLSNIKAHLNEQNQQTIDNILNTSKPLFTKFINRSGRETYNFWRTDSTYSYPYAGVLKPFTKKLTLPDDMDDTVLSLLALHANDSTAKSVHALMQQFVNSDTSRVRSIIEDYRNIPAYSTWFGKKFPVVFDISVLCNILSFVQLYNLPWTKSDTASLEIIIKTIENDYYFSKPVYASPYYPKTSLILYHVARLMSVMQIPELEMLRIKLVSDAAKELAQTNNTLEKIILSSTILKLGYEPPAITITSTDIITQIEQNDFCFFVGNIPSYFKDFSKAVATSKDLGFFYHYCPAYNDALLLEYLVLKNKQGR